MKYLAVGIIVLILIAVGGFLLLGSPNLRGLNKISEEPFNLATAAPLPGPLLLFQTAEVADNTVEVTYKLAEFKVVGYQAPDCTDCGILEPIPLSNLTAEDASFDIDIPDGISLVSGETSWRGDINDGEMKTIKLILRPERKGIWRITANANSGTLSGEGAPTTSYVEIKSFVMLYNGTKILLNPSCDPGYLDLTTLQCISRPPGPPEGEQV